MSEQQSRIPQQHCTMGQPRCFSEEDFYVCLVNFFRPFVSTKPMDWKCIEISMNLFAPFFKSRQELLDLYFDYVFGLFEGFRITDRAVIHSCVEMYCRDKLDNCFSWPSFQSAGDVLLSHPYLYRNLSVVKRILRYVAPVIIKWDDLYLYDYVRYVQRTICWEDSLVLHHDDPIYWNVASFGEGVDGRRFQLTLMVVDFLLQVRTDNSDEALKGLRLLFQTIPDSHVTWKEILGFLKSHIMCPSESMDTYIRSFKESCKQCYPECLQVLKPRSLKHLARCEVRRCLGQAHTLPHGVWDLRLPRSLEDFVLLQTRKDQFRPVIRPLSSEKVYPF